MGFVLSLVFLVLVEGLLLVGRLLWLKKEKAQSAEELGRVWIGAGFGPPPPPRNLPRGLE